jgi:hypothetical protein
MLLLAIGVVAAMIFGGVQGLGIGLILLWFIFTIVFPALCGDALTKRFGETWGVILAFAPLWLPLLLALLAWLLLPDRIVKF